MTKERYVRGIERMIMGEFAENPSLLSDTLGELIEVQDQSDLPPEVILQRYKDTSSVIIDYFDRLTKYAEAEDHHDVLAGMSTSELIQTSVAGYPDYLNANLGVEALLSDAYDKIRQLEG